MAWRDDLTRVSLDDGRELVAGSFRGVPFRTVAAEIRVGRRNVVNEYPQRDEPYVDDLGRRARRFVVDAYVIGDDYLSERDDLIDAIEEGGSGELIHPRYGIRNVSVDGEVSVKESPEMGGMARITVTFVEDAANQFPEPEDDTVAGVEAAADDADELAEEAFADEFSVEGISALEDEAVDAMTENLDGLVEMASQVTSGDALSSVTQLAGDIAGSISQLLRAPAQLVQGVRQMYAQVIDGVERPLAAFSQLQGTFAANTRLEIVTRPGSSLARGLVNDTALADLQRRLALTNQARALAVAIVPPDQAGAPSVTTASRLVPADAAPQLRDRPLQTSDEAVALRDALVGQIDTELEVNDPPPDMARSLTYLRAAVVRDVGARGELLQKRSTFAPQAMLPAVVLAHRVYQDARRADELMARNDVAHPAFMPAQELEILR